MSGAFLDKNNLRSVGDRGRRAAFWVSLAAFAQINFIFILFATQRPMLPWHWGLYAFYAITHGTIAWSARRDWHFKLILNLGYGLMFVEIWLRSFLFAIYPETSSTAVHVPVLLFLPVFLMLVAGSRTLLFYAVVQGLLVYAYVKYYLATVYGFSPDIVDLSEVALVLGLVSFIALIILAIVAYSREKTDRRLLALIRETERLAAEDPLTGLKNRRAFMNDIEALWNEAESFAVVFIDLDRFKPLNDEYGHAIGDQVLQQIGARLQSTPAIFSAARFGGDEFAALILVDDADERVDANMTALHQSLTGAIDFEFAQISVGASLGYARAVHDGFSVSELLHAADTAMMRCKTNGGGVAKFNPEIDDISLSSSAMSEAFKKALAQGQIRPALQPVIDTKTKAVIGHELLARWPNSGLARDPSPAEFIPIAENLGLLNQLLWTTMREALPYLRDSDGFLAINASPSQLSSTSFLDDLTAITATYGFGLDRIEIEITEHVAFRNLNENIRTLKQARAMGCRVSLDDFGSGYSSLSMLEELPLDKIKIDKSLQSKQHSGGVLRATIRLATELGFECCVEGIETERAAKVATELGCSQMQGFWFGHPEIIQRDQPPLRVAS